MNGRILVTGAQGLLGRALVTGLRAKGIAIPATGRRAPAADDMDYQQADLCDRDAVEALFDAGDLQAVVHTAAQIRASGDDGDSCFFRNNVLATTHLAEAARATDTQQFVNCSTISVYNGEGPYDELSSPTVPGIPYGRSKLAAEYLLNARSGMGMRILNLRLAGLHGGDRDSGVVYHMMRNALAGAPLAVSEPESRFNLCFVEDVVAALPALLADAGPEGCETLNFANPEAFSLAELAGKILRVAGSESPVEPGEAPARNREMHLERLCRRLPVAMAAPDVHLEKLARRLRSEGAQ